MLSPFYSMPPDNIGILLPKVSAKPTSKHSLWTFSRQSKNACIKLPCATKWRQEAKMYLSLSPFSFSPLLSQAAVSHGDSDLMLGHWTSGSACMHFTPWYGVWRVALFTCHKPAPFSFQQAWRIIKPNCHEGDSGCSKDNRFVSQLSFIAT